jgi:preprotein translocase subunit YajC
LIPLQSPGSGFGFLIPLIPIFLIFYLLVFRPQQKRQKEHEAMLAALVKGDRVVTAGGLHGVVAGAEKDVLTLEVAVLKGERVRVKVDRSRIERKLEAASDKSGGADS